MKEKSEINLELSECDERMTEKYRSGRTLNVYNVPLTMIDDFENHPFKVRMDGDMARLVESVKDQGIITPIMLRRKEDGRYEIISGHRRRKACEILGFTEIPAEILELSRNESIMLMIDSNLHRSVILPSEKAFAYKMKLEAMKKMPGRKTKVNGAPSEHHSVGMKSRDLLAEEVGESKEQIRRYIRLTELIPGLLDMVDAGRIALRPAVEISYLNDIEQQDLLEAIEFADCTPSHAQAIRIRHLSEEGCLTPEVLNTIMDEEKPNQKEKIHLSYEECRKYIPAEVPYNRISDYIIEKLRLSWQNGQSKETDSEEK